MSDLPAATGTADLVVLIADADPPSRAIIGGILREHGIRVVEVADGVAALEMVREHRPAVLVTAAQLPGRSGLDITRELRRAGTDGPRVCMVSGRTLRQDVEKARLAGVDEYVARPFAPEVVCSVVCALIEGRPGTLAALDSMTALQWGAA